MTFTLPLSREWKKLGWKVKIRKDERLEPPHVTIVRGVWAWRFCLRTSRFLDGKPNPRDVPAPLLDEVEACRPLLIARWDALYPENPVRSGSEET